MSIEDTANIFGAQLGGSSPARAAAPTAQALPPAHLFENDHMEGDPDAGFGNEEPEEGGDAYEEEREQRSRQPRDANEGQRRGDDGRFLKNEGPIDDDKGEDGGEEEEGADEGGEDGEDGEARSGDRIAGVPADTKIKITVDGKEEEVTLKEATEGYIRTKTFHQRLSALDQEKSVVERDRAQYTNVLQQSQTALEGILAELKLAEPPEPDWNALYAADPVNAARQKALWDRYQDGKKSLQTQRQEVIQRQQAEHNENLRRYVSAESDKILTKFPHWKDPAAREKDQGAIKKTLKDAGFSDQEIGAVFDSRMVTIAMKAARFDRLSAQGMPRRSGRKPMPSGPAASPSRRSGPSNGSRALRNHAATQTLDSATDAFSAILNQE